MKAGKIIKKTKIKGKEVVFRYPKFEDVDDLLKLINSLVAEKSMVGAVKKKTREEELKWVTYILKKVENNTCVFVVAEIEGKIAGNANVFSGQYQSDRHVARFGISVHKKYRGLGLAQLLGKTAIREAKKTLKTKIIKLDVHSENKEALKLYRKLGFQILGKIKKGRCHYGKYMDAVLMIKYL